MKLIAKQVYRVFLSGILSVLGSGMASATTYIDSNGKISLNLSEKGNNRFGFYYTKGDGYASAKDLRNLLGDIKVTRHEGTPGTYHYQGTFQEQWIGPNGSKGCSGDITIARRTIGRTTQLGAEVTWTVKGGDNCPSIGKTLKVNVLEPLPRPDANGNFTAANANTWLTQTAGNATWPKWSVTSSDGKLNCRQTPNGAIAFTYTKGKDTIVPEGRMVDAIELSNGSPWMRTNKRCYVRANSQYIKPISLPD